MNTPHDTQEREIILTGDRATGPLHLKSLRWFTTTTCCSTNST